MRLSDRAEVWAKLDDAYVRDLPPPADIFRGFLPSFDGCPVHGEAVFPGAGRAVAGGYFQPSLENQVRRGRRGVPLERLHGLLPHGRPGTLLTGDYADDGIGMGPGGRAVPVLVRSALLLQPLAPPDSGAPGPRPRVSDHRRRAVRPEGRDPAGQDGGALSDHGPRLPVLVRPELSGRIYRAFSVRRSGVFQHRALRRSVRQSVSGIAVQRLISMNF